MEEERVEIVGSQALDEGLVVVSGPPAGLVQPDAGVEILGDGLDGNATDVLECAAEHECGRSTPEHAVVTFLAGQDDLEEHALGVAIHIEVLKGIPIGEIVRSLDERHRRVVEIADGGIE